MCVFTHKPAHDVRISDWCSDVCSPDRAHFILRIPPAIVWPIVLLFAMIGAFAIDNSLFGIIIMLTIGVLAFIMEENGIPVAPTILGLVLGPILEGNFMTAMIKADEIGRAHV